MTIQRRPLDAIVTSSGDRLDVSMFPAPPLWVLDANCVGTDPEAFFPEKGGSTREAKRICARCTVQAECLDYSLGERFGIYGGLSERERRDINKALNKESA